MATMTKRKPKYHNPLKLIEAIIKLPNPMYDKKHNLYIYIEGRARSNETRIDHIVEYGHDLKVRDIKAIKDGITSYFAYKKDPTYKDTYNYYIKRMGMSKGFIKVSIQIDPRDSKKAWIKTVYITYNVK